MNRRQAITATLLLAATPASAVTISGTQFPDQMTVGTTPLALNGAAVRIFFGFVHGYASALYVRTPAHTDGAILGEPGPKVLMTKYLHNASAGQMRREFANVHDPYCAKHACSPANEASYRQMVASLTPVKEGETSTFIITDTGLQVMRDERPVLTINNPAYGGPFLDAAIGPTSPAPGYRAGLLGTHN